MTIPPQGGTDFVPAVTTIPGDTSIYELVGEVLTGGSQQDSGQLQISSPSYIIAGSFECVSGTTDPYVTVALQWSDPVTGVYFDTTEWIIPANTGPVTPTVCQWAGRGPTEGGQVQAVVVNNDGSEQLTVWLYLYQSSRVVTRHDWRSPGLFSPPTVTLADGDPAANILGVLPLTPVAAGNSITQLLPLYAGQVYLDMAQSAGQSVQLLVIPQDPNLSGTIHLYDNTVTGNIVAEPITLPRCPCTVTVHNTGAANTNILWTVVAQEFAS